MHIERVASLKRPDLAPYATLRQHEEHRHQGIFVAEGLKVVRRLLESDFGVVSVLLPEKFLAELEPLIRARSEDVPVFVMEIAELEKLTGFPFFQGVLAVGKIPRTHSIDSILANTPQPRLFVAADGLANAENLGLIVRNCVAFGVQALIVGENSSSPFLRRAVRNSMGAIFKLPVVECGGSSPPSFNASSSAPTAGNSAKENAATSHPAPNLVEAIADLCRAHVRCIGAHPHTEQRSIYDAEFTTDCCIVLGSEGTGLSPAIRDACDDLVAIPMGNEVDSLNVGSAAAVFLYEAARQRDWKRRHDGQKPLRK